MISRGFSLRSCRRAAAVAFTLAIMLLATSSQLPKSIPSIPAVHAQGGAESASIAPTRFWGVFFGTSGDVQINFNRKGIAVRVEIPREFLEGVVTNENDTHFIESDVRNDYYYYNVVDESRHWSYAWSGTDSDAPCYKAAAKPVPSNSSTEGFSLHDSNAPWCVEIWNYLDGTFHTFTGQKFVRFHNLNAPTIAGIYNFTLFVAQDQNKLGLPDFFNSTSTTAFKQTLFVPVSMNDNPATIIGTICDDDTPGCTPIVQTKGVVYARNINTGQLARAYVNQTTGGFNLTGLAPGDYEIRASAGISPAGVAYSLSPSCPDPLCRQVLGLQRGQTQGTFGVHLKRAPQVCGTIKYRNSLDPVQTNFLAHSFTDHPYLKVVFPKNPLQRPVLNITVEATDPQGHVFRFLADNSVASADNASISFKILTGTRVTYVGSDPYGTEFAGLPPVNAGSYQMTVNFWITGYLQSDSESVTVTTAPGIAVPIPCNNVAPNPVVMESGGVISGTLQFRNLVDVEKPVEGETALELGNIGTDIFGGNVLVQAFDHSGILRGVGVLNETNPGNETKPGPRTFPGNVTTDLENNVTLRFYIIGFSEYNPNSNVGVHISRVQTARGTWSSGSSFTVTLTSPPQNGNSLIMTIGSIDASSGKSVSSVSQTGATWAKQVGNGLGRVDNEIWLASNVQNAGTTITITLSGTPSAGSDEIANLAEYSGLTNTPFDNSATNTGNSNAPDTGTTTATTQSIELWVGSTSITSASQSSPTNRFTLIDGALGPNAGGSNAYLEKIVSSIGTANSGTAASSANTWAGAIATFKAKPTPTCWTPTCITYANKNQTGFRTWSGVWAERDYGLPANQGYSLNVYIRGYEQQATSTIALSKGGNTTVRVQMVRGGAVFVAVDSFNNRFGTRAVQSAKPFRFLNLAIPVKARVYFYDSSGRTVGYVEKKLVLGQPNVTTTSFVVLFAGQNWSLREIQFFGFIPTHITNDTYSIKAFTLGYVQQEDVSAFGDLVSLSRVFLALLLGNEVPITGPVFAEPNLFYKIPEHDHVIGEVFSGGLKGAVPGNLTAGIRTLSLPVFGFGAMVLDGTFAGQGHFFYVSSDGTRYFDNGLDIGTYTPQIPEFGFNRHFMQKQTVTAIAFDDLFLDHGTFIDVISMARVNQGTRTNPNALVTGWVAGQSVNQTVPLSWVKVEAMNGTFDRSVPTLDGRFDAQGALFLPKGAYNITFSVAFYQPQSLILSVNWNDSVPVLPPQGPLCPTADTSLCSFSAAPPLSLQIVSTFTGNLLIWDRRFPPGSLPFEF